MEFKVSVIIPVYNAERYVRRAVESAVHLIEVGEVLLIEDKSPDNALEICYQLESEFEKVRLLRHPNGENKGAGASRNLGIDNALFDYVAFLDADDWYLENRFAKAKEIFIAKPDVDGVYDSFASKSVSENDSDYLRYIYGRQVSVGETIVHNVFNDFPASLLFEKMLEKKAKFFHTNSITLKKSFLNIKKLRFSEDLKLHQDSFLWHQLAYSGMLVPGETKYFTSVRTYHGDNRESKKNYKSISKYYCKLYNWSKFNKLSLYQRALIFKKFILHHPLRENTASENPFRKYWRLIKIILNHSIDVKA